MCVCVYTHTHTHIYIFRNIYMYIYFWIQIYNEIFFIFPEDIPIDFRESRREGERERGREVSMWERNINQLIAFHMIPDRGPNPQCRYVTWLEIEPESFWFMRRCTNQLSNTARVIMRYLIYKYFLPVWRFSFNFLISVFQIAEFQRKILNFDKVQFLLIY